MSDNFLKIRKGMRLSPSTAPSNPQNGDMYYDNSTNKFKKYENGAWSDLGSGGGGGGSISDWLTATPYTVGQVASLDGKLYKCLTAHTSNTFSSDIVAGYWVEISYEKNGSLIDQSTPVLGVSSWSTYRQTVVGARPTGVYSGTPADLVLSTSTSSPLSKYSSFQITKPGSNCQGQGVKVDFTVPNSMKAKLLQVEIDYQIAFGTFSGGNGNTDSDIILYIIDKDSGAAIEPVNFKIAGMVAGGVSMKTIATFQASANSTNYTFVLHVATTSTAAYTFKFDNVKVSELLSTLASYSKSPSRAGFIQAHAGSSVPTGWLYCDGSAVSRTEYADLFIAIGTTWGSGDGSTTFNLPNLQAAFLRGDGSQSHGGVAYTGTSVGSKQNDSFQDHEHSHPSGTGGFIYYLPGSGPVNYAGGNNIGATGQPTGFASSGRRTSETRPFNAGVKYIIKAYDDVQAYSGNTQSEGIVAVKYYGNDGQSLTADITDIPFKTKEFDSHGAWDGSKFIAPIAGLYEMDGVFYTTSNIGGSSLQSFKNGSGSIYVSMGQTGTSRVGAFRGTLYLNKGDTWSIRSPYNLTLNTGDTINWISFKRVSTQTNTIIPVADLSKDKDNFISNGNFELNMLGWNTYADAAGVSPVDGSGGTPSVSFVSTNTVGEVLSGKYSAKFIKAAANEQGEGVSYDFSIDEARTGKNLQISFDAELLSGTYVDGDMRVYIYDVTNAAIIEPVNVQVALPIAGIPTKHIATFQSAINSTSYRLIFHCASTSASAYTVLFDNVTVWDSVGTVNAIISDWTDFTPTGSFTTNTTYYGKWRRVGSNVEVQYKVQFSGAPNAVACVLNLPSGMVIDASKMPQGSLINAALFSGIVRNGSTGDQYGVVAKPYSTTAIELFNNRTSTTYAIYDTQLTNTSPLILANPDQLAITVSYPIVGWSSSQTVYSGYSNEVVAVKYYGNAGQSLTADVTDIPYATKEVDTHGAWDGSKFTAPIAGLYEMDGLFYLTTDLGATGLQSYKNGSGSVYVGANVAWARLCQYRGTLYLNKGDTWSIRSPGTRNLSADNSLHWISIKRISAQTIVPIKGETVACRYEGNSGQALSGSGTDIIYTTKAYDTHNTYNNSTGVWTCPIAGYYSFRARGGAVGVATANNQYFEIALKHSSDAVVFADVMFKLFSGENRIIREVNGDHYCNVGDTVIVKSFSDMGSSRTFESDTWRASFEAKKI